MSQVQAPLAAQPPVPRMLQWLKLLPGTGLSGVIALAATFVSTPVSYTHLTLPTKRIV